jgi:hypothetical protein
MEAREVNALAIAGLAIIAILGTAIFFVRRGQRDRGPKHISVDLLKKD